tara:strand:+ start:826 stop:1248 length:423 start_codon:yes stop_codon:yes gene_type:complete
LIELSQQNALIDTINRVDTELKFHASLAHNTANHQTLAYLKVLKKLGLNDSGVSDTGKEIAALEALLKDQREHESIHESLVQASTQAKETVERLGSMSNVQQPWARFLGKMELAFVIVGTLQWGYGNIWVETLHKELLSL